MAPRLATSKAKAKAKAKPKGKVKAKAKAEVKAKAKPKAMKKPAGAGPVFYASSMAEQPMADVLGDLNLPQCLYVDTAPERQTLQDLAPSTVKSTALKLKKLLEYEATAGYGTIVVLVFPGMKGPFAGKGLRETLYLLLGLSEHLLSKNTMDIELLMPEDLQAGELKCKGWKPQGKVAKEAAQLMSKSLTDLFTASFQRKKYAPRVYGGFLEGSLLAIVLLETAK